VPPCGKAGAKIGENRFGLCLRAAQEMHVDLVGAAQIRSIVEKAKA
jgi:hypothetical protein